MHKLFMLLLLLLAMSQYELTIYILYTYIGSASIVQFSLNKSNRLFFSSLKKYVYKTLMTSAYGEIWNAFFSLIVLYAFPNKR